MGFPALGLGSRFLIGYLSEISVLLSALMAPLVLLLSSKLKFSLEFLNNLYFQLCPIYAGKWAAAVETEPPHSLDERSSSFIIIINVYSAGN